MRYRAETFALYDTLFTEAHQALMKEAMIKEARIFQRMGTALQRGWQGLTGRTAREMAAREAKMTEMAGALGEADRAAALAEAKRKALEATHARARRELKQFGADPGALTSAQRWRNIGLAGTGLGAAAVPAAYYAGQSGAEQKGRTARNLAFGAGAAAGLAAPQLVTGLGAIANAAGQTGLFPDLQGVSMPDPNNPQGSY